MLELKYFKIQKGDNTTPNIIKKKLTLSLTSYYKMLLNKETLRMETSQYNHISTKEFHLIRI